MYLMLYSDLIVELGCSVAAFLPPANQTHQDCPKHQALIVKFYGSVTQTLFTTLFTQYNLQCVNVERENFSYSF